MKISSLVQPTLLCLALLLMVCADATAQPGGGRGRGQGGRGGGFGGGRGGFGGGGVTALIQRQDVQDELALSESQIGQIETLIEDSQPQGGGFGGGNFGNFQDLTPEERQEAFARIQAERAQQQSELRTKVKSVLSASQSKRLTELEIQFALQRNDARAVLEALEVELSESDQQQLTEKSQEVNRKVQEQIAKIQREAQMEILASVIDTAKVQASAGEEFTFEGGGGFGRGGQGGRGGGRGQGDAAGGGRGGRRESGAGDAGSAEESPDSAAGRRRRE